MKRRTFLSALAAVPVAAAVPTLVIADDDELGRLIKAHRVAREEEERYCDAFSVFERTNGVGRHDLPQYQVLWDALGEAHAAEYEAFYDLLEYRPRSLEEVRRRCDYILSDGTWFNHVDGEDDSVEDFIRSMASV